MLYDEIADFLADHAITWKFDDGYRTPEGDVVEATIDKMLGMLYDDESMSEIEVGGILLARNDDHFDLYVHIGEVR